MFTWYSFNSVASLDVAKDIQHNKKKEQNVGIEWDADDFHSSLHSSVHVNCNWTFKNNVSLCSKINS